MKQFLENQKKVLLAILILLAIFPYTFFLKPQKAEALFGVGDVVEVIWDVPRDVPVPAGAKEGVLDLVAWTVSKLMISALTESVVNWINSGFEGSPAFVQDPAAYFTDLADQASGAFITQLGMEGILCSPFKLPVLYGLKMNYSYSAPSMRKFQCTLGEAAEEWDDFMGDFVNGGWDRWLSINTNEMNNPYGAYFASVNEIERKRATAAERGKLEASWGSGFVSLKECVGGKSQQDSCIDICDNSTANWGEEDEDWEECHADCMENEMSVSELCEESGGQMKNTTPGKVIADQLTTSLGSTFRQLEIADEINESLSTIFNALINQLINQGLESLSSSSSGSGNSGWTSTPPTQDEKNNTAEIISNSIIYEINYRNVEQNSLDKYDWAIGIVKNLKECYEKKGGMQNEISNEITPLLNDLNSKRQAYETAVNQSNDLLEQAEDIKEKILNSGTFDKMYSLLQEFESDIKPQLHNAGDATVAENDFKNSVKPYLESLINGASGMQEKLNQCLSESTTP